MLVEAYRVCFEVFGLLFAVFEGGGGDCVGFIARGECSCRWGSIRVCVTGRAVSGVSRRCVVRCGSE